MAKDLELINTNLLSRRHRAAQIMLDNIKFQCELEKHYWAKMEQEEQLAKQTKCHMAEHEASAKLYFKLSQECSDHASTLILLIEELGYAYGGDGKIIFFEGDEVEKFSY